MGTQSPAQERPTVQLALDEHTLNHVQQRAQAAQRTVEEYLQELIAEHVSASEPLLGLFKDEPEVLDCVVKQAMIRRETQPWRQSGE